jgi:DNA-binding transcriptional MerR regulator
MSASLPNTEGFVSVIEASRLLGLSESQTRRYARHMPVIDRHEAGTVTGVKVLLVRLDSLSKLAGKTLQKEEVTVYDGHAMNPDDRHNQVSDGHMNLGQNRELLDQVRNENTRMQEEIAFLRSALEREQQNTARALDQLAEAENRSKVIMGAMATGRIPASLTAGATQDAPTAKDEQEAVSKADNRPWWQFWGRG